MTTLYELQLELLAWLVLAVAGGLVTAVVWFSIPVERRRLLPPRRNRAVPWGGLEVGLTLCIYLLLPSVVMGLLSQAGWYRWVYGSGFATPGDPTASKLDVVRWGLWASVLALPIQLLAIWQSCRTSCDLEPYQLGLAPGRRRADATLGYLGWLVLAPLILGINTVAVLLQNQFSPAVTPDLHPLARLLTGDARPVEWVLVTLSAVVAAPIFEELIFRGLLQGWFSRRSWGGDAAFGAALCGAVLNGERRLAPILFVLLLLPVHLALSRFNRSRAERAIFGTAVLFAAVHSSVWPSPVALFPLGLALGFLAHRTQGLIAPIIFHGLFNGVACLMLFLAVSLQPPEVTNGKAATSAGSGAPAATWTAVPGSWCPRRR